MLGKQKGARDEADSRKSADIPSPRCFRGLRKEESNLDAVYSNAMSARIKEREFGRGKVYGVERRQDMGLRKYQEAG